LTEKKKRDLFSERADELFKSKIARRLVARAFSMNETSRSPMVRDFPGIWEIRSATNLRTKSNYGYDRAKITLHDDTCVFLSVFRPPEITRLPLQPGCYEIWYPAEREREREAARFDVTGSKASLIKMFPGWPQSGQFDCLLTLRLFFPSFFFSDVLHAKLLRHPIELKLVAKQFTAPVDISFFVWHDCK